MIHISGNSRTGQDGEPPASPPPARQPIQPTMFASSLASAVGSLNYLRRALPMIVAAACALSAGCFSVVPAPTSVVELGGGNMTVPAAVHNQSSPTASDSLLQFTSQLATGSTTPRPKYGITPLLLPYHGKWLWDSSAGTGSFVSSDCHSTNVQHGSQSSHAALVSASEAAVIRSRSTSLPVI